MHYLLMRNVGVSEHHLVDRVPAHQRRQLVLGRHRNPVRVPRSGERRAVHTSGDARDLCRSKRNHLDTRVLPVDGEALHQAIPYPLDMIGTGREGMIGYLLEQELINELPARPAATLLTQVIVDANDPAFVKPTKPIGPVYDQNAAIRVAAERHWSIALAAEHYRRVVASPEPRSIVELGAVRLLVCAGVLVICVGGGGIPVAVDEEHRLHGTSLTRFGARARNTATRLARLRTPVVQVR